MLYRVFIPIFTIVFLQNIAISSSQRVACPNFFISKFNRQLQSCASQFQVKTKIEYVFDEANIHITVHAIDSHKKFQQVALRPTNNNTLDSGRWISNNAAVIEDSCGGVLFDSQLTNNLEIVWILNSNVDGIFDIELAIAIDNETVTTYCSKISIVAKNNRNPPNTSLITMKPLVFDSTVTTSPTSTVGLNVSWTFEPGNITRVRMAVFNLQTSQWSAIGFSVEGMMGNSHVFICQRLANNTINVGRYINPGGHQEPTPVGNEEGGVFHVEKESLEDNLVLCEFSLSNFQDENIEHIQAPPRLSQSSPYYPIIAIGQLDSDDEILRHAKDSRLSQSYQVQLNRPQVVAFRVPATTEKTDFLKIHGIIMIVSWILIATTGTLFARYFKNSWSSYLLCGKAVWFTFHRLLMSLTTVLTVLGFMFIFTYNKASWTTDGDASKHAILGAIVTCLAFIQPFIAIFRCDPNSNYRFIFNYLHAFIGTSALSLSMATIFLATYYFTDIFPNRTSWILVTLLIVWIVLAIILFELVTRKLGSGKTSDRRLLVNIARKQTEITSMGESAGEQNENNLASNILEQRIKIVILSIHVFVATGISIALIVPVSKLS